MKLIKAHMDVVICIVVALVAGILCYWPTLSWDADLQADRLERYNKIKIAQGYVGTIELPGGLSLKNVTAEDVITDKYKAALEKMKTQAGLVEALAATENQTGRIAKGNGGADREIPLLVGKDGMIREDNFLPAIVPPADAFGFKNAFEGQFAIWVEKLVGAPNTSGMPPSAADVNAQIAAAIAELARKNAANNAIFPGGGQGGAVAQLSIKEQNRIKRDAVLTKAARLRMYVDEAALQRPISPPGTPPTEPQIFEAFVYSWLQQDVVNAIATINEETLKSFPAADRNVGHSAVKRLESIVIGNAALGSAAAPGSGSLFVIPTGGSSGAPANPNGLDPSRSLTGHVSCEKYDVVMMRITVDIDPAFQNKFIETLYKQNNGYTVLNWNLRTVDPLDATSNGYLYGPTQVVRIELLVETLLFRSWTLKLMPPATLAALVPPAPPAAGPGH